MKLDDEAADAKRSELLNAVAQVSRLDDRVLDSVFTAFGRVTPPEAPEDRVLSFLITIDSSPSIKARSARSQKPGNIFLNWRNLLEIAPDGGLAVVTATTSPISPEWLVPLAALYIWNKVWRRATVQFSDAEATTILALWRNRDAKNKIPEDAGFHKTNELRKAANLGPLTTAEFAAVINRLVKMHCIELDEGVVWLREWIRVNYKA